jgi:toxin ParE1/3/4
MVKWTDHALTQLRHIHAYIAQDSAFYAKRVSQALVHKTLGLNELPRRGRIVPELNDENVRELSLYSYRILYEIKTSGIEVLAVIHKRRDLQQKEIRQDSTDD